MRPAAGQPAYPGAIMLPVSAVAAVVASTEPAPIVLDIEASGFGPHSYPIEIGFVRADGTAFCTLIRPEPAWQHWDDAAENVHHIPREAAVRCGRSVADVALSLNQQLASATVYSDGWAHDYSWLGTLFEAAGLTPAFRLENLRALLSEQQAEQWHVVKQQVMREMQLQRHRASADARVLQATLLRLHRLKTVAGH